MKRVICILLCLLLLLAGSGAFAFWEPHPLTNEPFYDPSSGILSGTIIWSDVNADANGNNRLQYVNLETGESGQIDLGGYYYLVYSDLPGAVVAREADGKLFLSQTDLEGNLTPILEMDFPITSYVHHNVNQPATVYAYYDGWIYLNMSENYSWDISLVRIKPDENKLFAYRTVSYLSHLALSPGGKLAWIVNIGEETDRLVIQNPEDGSILEVPFTGEYARINPLPGQPLWRNENTLVFCDVHNEGEKTTYPLYAYHLSSRKISPVKRKDGSHIVLPYGFVSNVQLNRDESQLYVGSVWGDAWFCVVDIDTSTYYKIDPNPAFSYSRQMWYND